MPDGIKNNTEILVFTEIENYIVIFIEMLKKLF